MFDYLIVGTGLYGAVCANELKARGKKVLMIEQRNHVGGNIYTENQGGIQVHKYGAHIFHTNDKVIWSYINQFAEFNRFTNSPVANFQGRLYNLPFNMNTFYQLWGVLTPEQAKMKIAEQQKELNGKEPENLEEQAISLVGRDIYEALIKGYTEKQWGRDCTDLPPFIIKRLPVRFTFDNNYFNDKYQGVPIGGYTQIIEAMIKGVEVRLDTDFFGDEDRYRKMAKKIIYTGPIDRYFGYRFGKLEYRSLRFENETINVPNAQGNAVVNYTERDVPYTRIIEHKHFDPVDTAHTVVTKEYPAEWEQGMEPYYPVNNEKNDALYRQYRALTKAEDGVFFGGRLAEYRYYDMHQVIGSALADLKKTLS